MLFNECFNKYYEYTSLTLKPQTRISLLCTFEEKIIPFFCNYDIKDINEDIFIQWKMEIEKNNYSNNYKKRLYYSMVAFYDYLIKLNIININIPKKVGNFKMQNIKVKHDFYTYKEFKHFIKYVDNFIYKSFFNFMFFTGTRPGEAMALKFSDLDYYEISINKTISEHSMNGNRVITSPKTLTSNRKIYLDRKLYKNILKLKIYYDNKYNKDFDYYIFGGIKPLAPTSINRIKNIACNKANLRPIKLHEFRHSHASLLFNHKIDVETIKDRLGHSDITTTLNVYIHSNINKQKKVYKTLNFLRLIFR